MILKKAEAKKKLFIDEILSKRIGYSVKQLKISITKVSSFFKRSREERQ